MDKYAEQVKLHNKLKVKREIESLKKLEKDIFGNMKDLKEKIIERIEETGNSANGWSYDEFKKNKRLEAMNEDIKKEIKAKKEKEYALIVGFLMLSAARNRKELGVLLQEEKKDLSALDVKEIIQAPWAGLSLLERHGRSTQNFALKVKETLNLSLLNEKASKRRTVKAISEEIDKASRAAFSLADTENTHMGYEMVKRVVEEEKRGRVMLIYNAILDGATCKNCFKDDGKIFFAGDEPSLPRHPNCRCFYTVALEKVG